ncbi:MAG: hypothetical protein J07HQW2_00518 [Haloquadratum walsbyi J07HQW2]|uniref:Uncharacterized protein n=1 Tax=Haloquadratum walsbyi J07HQW2 TaxID=1238425 RepID=U1MUP8_9EURY|nr:MAG: hypothetical protein J07HQW2_00518 [Haloquadratum walsbyi J07HQW2]
MNLSQVYREQQRISKITSEKRLHTDAEEDLNDR